MIKYKTYANRFFHSNIAIYYIAPIYIERETEKSVFFSGGRRQAKISEFEIFHNTWEDARNYLKQKAKDKLASARLQLQDAQGHYGNIKGLKKDA